MADKPVDTEGARADLGFGNQYFDRWFKQKPSEQKKRDLQPGAEIHRRSPQKRSQCHTSGEKREG